jgi:hypothetical protein
LTIADLMVVVAFTALASFGISTGLEGLIVGEMVALYLAAICIATVSGRDRRGTRRAPWNGFALFGWVWITLWVILLLHDSPPLVDQDAFSAFLAIGLVGSSLSAYASARLAPGDETPRPPAGEGGSYSP